LAQTTDILKAVLNIAEATASIIGFIHWKKIKNTHWKFFPVYLALILVAELVGRWLALQALYSINLSLYNYFVIPLEILFFVGLFYKEINPRQRWLPISAGCIYIGCWLADMLVIPKGPYIWIGSFSYTVGIVMLLVLIMVSLYKFATSNAIVFIKTNMMFWVCMGLFVFYAFSLPFYGMGNYLYHHHKSVYTGYFNVIYFLNYIMYALFTIAFIWGKPK
jgi:hypothetical protein